MNVEIDLPTHVKRQLAPLISRWDPRRNGRDMQVAMRNGLAGPGVTVNLTWNKIDLPGADPHFSVSPASPQDHKVVEAAEAELRKWHDWAKF